MIRSRTNIFVLVKYFDWIYMTNSYLIYYPLYNFSKIKLYSARDINHLTNNTCTKIINGTLFFTLPSHWILNTLLFAFPFKIAIWIDFAHIMLRCYIIWSSFSIFYCYSIWNVIMNFISRSWPWNYMQKCRYPNSIKGKTTHVTTNYIEWHINGAYKNFKNWSDSILSFKWNFSPIVFIDRH